MIARDVRRSFSDAAELVVEPESTQLTADGRALAYIDISAVDKDGNPVDNANNRVNIKVTGAGRLLEWTTETAQTSSSTRLTAEECSQESSLR